MTAEEAISWLNTDDYESAGFEEATRMAIDALKRQIPKKPTETNRKTVYRCANCKAIVMQNLPTEKVDYCIRCGQAIDWSEVDK